MSGDNKHFNLESMIMCCLFWRRSLFTLPQKRHSIAELRECVLEWAEWSSQAGTEQVAVGLTCVSTGLYLSCWSGAPHTWLPCFRSSSYCKKSSKVRGKCGKTISFQKKPIFTRANTFLTQNSQAPRRMYPSGTSQEFLQGCGGLVLPTS